MNYLFQVKGKTFDTQKQIITGEEILIIANLTPVDDFQLLLKVDDDTFEPIQLKETVDLSVPGKEKFIVKFIKEIFIFVNDEKYPFKDTFLTPREIVEVVEKDPDGYYLKQIDGHKDISYKNGMDNPIQIKNGLKLTTNLIGPTTVS